MSELTTAMNQPHEFKHKDKTYQVSLITQKVKAAYEQKQFSRARDAALLLKPCMDKKEYQEHLSQLNADYIAGHYGLETQNGLKLAQSSNGAIMLSSILFGISEEEMIKIMLDAKAEVQALLALVIKESFGIEDEAPAPATEQGQ